MKMHLFSIFDSKAASFNVPFAAPTFGVAERNFKTEIESPDSMLHKYPEDYILYVVGEYDTDTGVLTQRPPEAIVTASALVARGQASAA